MRWRSRRYSINPVQRMAAIAATGTPETSRRDPTKSAYKVKAVVPADIVRRPSLTQSELRQMPCRREPVGFVIVRSDRDP
jgi:hypothetical protein